MQKHHRPTILKKPKKRRRNLEINRLDISSKNSRYTMGASTIGRNSKELSARQRSQPSLLCAEERRKKSDAHVSDNEGARGCLSRSHSGDKRTTVVYMAQKLLVNDQFAGMVVLPTDRQPGYVDILSMNQVTFKQRQCLTNSSSTVYFVSASVKDPMFNRVELEYVISLKTTEVDVAIRTSPKSLSRCFLFNTNLLSCCLHAILVSSFKFSVFVFSRQEGRYPILADRSNSDNETSSSSSRLLQLRLFFHHDA